MATTGGGQPGPAEAAHRTVSPPQLGTIDPHADRPVYKQIADQLRAAIDAGQLQPGDNLPSESYLMGH